MNAYILKLHSAIRINLHSIIYKRKAFCVMLGLDELETTYRTAQHVRVCCHSCGMTEGMCIHTRART